MHPDNLPALVAGRLDQDQVSLVESHVRECDSCKQEVDALARMRDAIHFYSESEHVAVRLLVAYTGGSLVGDPRSDVEAHLAECAHCQSEAETLRRLSPEDSPEPSRRNSPWKLAFAISTAASLVLGLTLVMRTEGPRVEQLPWISFQLLRSAGNVPVLRGDGPWSVNVVLPTSIQQATCKLSIVDGQGVPVHEQDVSTNRDGRVVILIRRLNGPGAYRLRVTPLSGESGTLEYPFIVERE